MMDDSRQCSSGDACGRCLDSQILHFPRLSLRGAKGVHSGARKYSRCLFGSWHRISVRVLIAAAAVEAIPSGTVHRALQIFKAPACRFQVVVYKLVRRVRVQQFVGRSAKCHERAAMAATTELVTVALFFVLRAGAPARFPVSKLCKGGRASLVIILFVYLLWYINFAFKSAQNNLLYLIG